MHQAQGGFGAVDGSTGCPELIRQSRLALAEVDLARVHAAPLALRFSFSFSFFLSLSICLFLSCFLLRHLARGGS